MTPAKKLKVGVVGATGVVGQTFTKLIEEHTFLIEEYRPFASDNSQDAKIKLKGRDWPIQTLKTGCFKNLDLVFFSSGDEVSQEWAPQAVQAGAFAIDNSASFRMNSGNHLIIPEVNGHLIHSKSKPQIIANPNCSTIQLVLALKPLESDFGITEVRVASYQSVSGAGIGGIDELLRQMQDYKNKKPNSQVFPHPILFNAIPQIGAFDDSGFCSEEIKIQSETKKILDKPDLKISAFTVRVPTLNSHSEAVWVTLNKKVTRADFIKSLSNFPGLIIQDDPKKSIYPLATEVSGKDAVYVGRIHQDLQDPYLWIMWIVSDNVRKGAALNGLQIAEKIFATAL